MLKLWLSSLLVLLVGCVSLPPPEAAFASFTYRGVLVSLYKQECRLGGLVTNMPLRATWKQGGERFDGCFALQHGWVVLYFDDKTVVIVPADHFKRPHERGKGDTNGV